MSKSNIFNRQSNAATLPDTINISDSNSSLSTSSEVTTSPSLISTGSAVIEKDLKVDDIAYFNECRINTLRSADTKPGQGFLDYVSLYGQKIDNQNVLSVNGNLKTTEIEAEDLILKKSKTSKTFYAAPNAATGAPLFRTIEASDIPDLDYAPKFSTNLTQKTFYAASNAATGAPLFRTIEASDIPDLDYAPKFSTNLTQKTFYAAPNAATGAPSFRTILASDIPELNYAPKFGIEQKNYVFATGPTADGEYPAFRSIVPADFNFQNCNTILAGPISGTGAAPSFRNLVPADFGTTNQENKILGGNASNGPTFRNIATGDFGNVVNLLPSKVYLSVDATGATGQKPSWSTISISNTEITTALAAVGVVGFGSVPNFPKQNKNVVFASSSSTDDTTPAFRALDVADFPSQIVTTKTKQVAKKVLAGPIIGNEAEPTWRSLELTDLPTAVQTSASIPSTTIDQKTFYAAPNAASGVPSFRTILASDIPALSYLPSSTTILNLADADPLSSTTNLLLATPTFEQFTCLLISVVTTSVGNPGNHFLTLNTDPGKNFPKNTKISFNKSFGTIVANTIYYISTYNAATLVFKISETVDGPVKIMTNSTASTVDILFTPAPNFRNITPADFGTDNQANKILGGNASNGPTFRNITPADFGTDNQANKILGGNASNGPTFRSITENDFGNVTPNRVLAGASSGSTSSKPTFRVLVGGDFGQQSPNKLLAGPTSGNNSVPTFRHVAPNDLNNVDAPAGGGASSSQFIGLKNYSKTKFTFTNDIVSTYATSVLTMTESVTGTATPILSSSNYPVVGTGISFDKGIGTLIDGTNVIIKDQIYYVTSFGVTSTTASSSVTTYTYTMAISSVKNGPQKLLADATVTGYTLSIRNIPFIARTIAGVTTAPPPGSSTPEGEQPVEEPAPSTQPPNVVYAGPPDSTNGDMEPSYRALVAADIPDLSLTYAPKSNSPNYAPTFTSQEANTFFASPNGSSGIPLFRSLVPADIPALDYAPSIVGNQLLNTDQNHTINAAIHTFTIWSSGVSATARTFNVINLIPGRRVMISLYNFWSAAKTISFTASATDTIGSAPFMSKGDAGGVNTSSVTLATNGVATIQLFNAGGVIRGSIG